MVLQSLEPFCRLLRCSKVLIQFGERYLVTANLFRKRTGVVTNVGLRGQCSNLYLRNLNQCIIDKKNLQR